RLDARLADDAHEAPELRLGEAARERDLDRGAALGLALLVVRLEPLVPHDLLAVVRVADLAAHLHRDRLRRLLVRHDANDPAPPGTLAGHVSSSLPRARPRGPARARGARRARARRRGACGGRTRGRSSPRCETGTSDRRPRRGGASPPRAGPRTIGDAGP